MSKLQTYISERKKLFKDKFGEKGVSGDYVQITMHSLPDIESFNEETIEGVLAIVMDEFSEGENGNGYTIINKERLLQTLNTKE